MKAVIMCGGLGSRLRPLTESIPKPLIRIANRPVVEIIIEKVADAGIKEIYLSLGYLADDITEFCNGIYSDTELKFCNENIPLGTAGGVKNCINESEEDILILGGDNIFDINISEFIQFFKENNCDAAICGVNVDDPREYGTIVCDEGGRIRSFIEKPTWEQADSFLVNTGIYLIKGSILKMIKEKCFCDFANDIFPELLKNNKKFYCYKSAGYWGDIGEFEALKKISDDILNGRCKINMLKGRFFAEDTVIGENTIIKSPCLIGENVEFGSGGTIGPYSVIDSDCVIGNSTNITRCIIGASVRIGENSQITDSIISDRVSIKDNCVVEDNCVFGYGVELGRFSRVLAGNKIWPGRRISEQALVSKDIIYDSPSSVEFDIFGISGRIFDEFSINDALSIGKAVSSVNDIKRIGIGTDGSAVSENYKNCTIAGISVCGSECYDYGIMFKGQAYFYSAYSSLDFFVYITNDGENINYSFFGRQGLPVSLKTAKSINNNYKFSVFSYSASEKCTELIPADYLSSVYISFVKKILGINFSGIKINIESENSLIKKTAEAIFSDYMSQNVVSDKRCIHFLFNKSVSEMYVVYGNKTFSGERIISLICELELAAGNTIIIPEDFPSFIETVAENYHGKVIRIYDINRDDFIFSDRNVLLNLWAFDCLILSAKLISYLQMTGYTIDELFKNQKYFAMRKSVLNVDKNASEIREIIKNFAVKRNNDIFYVFENRKGRVRIRQIGNSARIRILAESYDIESAKEISVFIEKKINECNIDNDTEKL